MILSRDELLEAIIAEKIFVGSDEKHRISSSELEFDTVSIEMHLKNNFFKWRELKKGETIIIDPNIVDLKDIEGHYTEKVSLETDGAYILMPKDFVLCTTFEHIYLPPTLCGRIEGKTKLARLGVSIHMTAPTIQADWAGVITLEIANHSTLPIRLKPTTITNNSINWGTKIGQLIVEEIKGSASRHGRETFNDQTSPLGT